MNLPDETMIEDEIKEISVKIDAIIRTVNEVYPLKTDSVQEFSENADPQED